MKIHTSQGAHEYVVADVDSITFGISWVDMVLVPAGTFLMGDGVSFCGEDEREVTLTHPFYLGRYEVTNQEYIDSVQWAYDHGYVTATASAVTDNLDGSTEELLDLDSSLCEIAFNAGAFSLRDAGFGINGDHPVKEVSWFGAARYCDWLSLRSGLPRAYEHTGDWSCNGGDPYGASGYRLPTDAEWEFAAQYDDERIYPWGNEAPDCSRASYHPCVGWTTPVGGYPGCPSVNGEVLYDLAGNVWEWCNDWGECSLGTDPVTDPMGLPSGSYRVFRGGSYGHDPADLRVAGRQLSWPIYSLSSQGFRVARTQ
jgi:formylglycine-generating enzyme required for sulfatase activity